MLHTHKSVRAITKLASPGEATNAGSLPYASATLFAWDKAAGETV